MGSNVGEVLHVSDGDVGMRDGWWFELVENFVGSPRRSGGTASPDHEGWGIPIAAP